MSSLPERWKKGPRPNSEVIELLDALRDAASRGLIRAMTVVTVNPIMKVETTDAGELDQVRRDLLCGGLVRAAHSITKTKAE